MSWLLLGWMRAQVSECRHGWVGVHWLLLGCLRGQVRGWVRGWVGGSGLLLGWVRVQVSECRHGWVGVHWLLLGWLHCLLLLWVCVWVSRYVRGFRVRVVRHLMWLVPVRKGAAPWRRVLLLPTGGCARGGYVISVQWLLLVP